MTMSRTTPALDPSRTTPAPSAKQARAGRTRLSATFLGLIAGAAVLSGCAVPDVASMSPNLPQRQPTASPSASATPKPAPRTVPAAPVVAAPVAAAPVTASSDTGVDTSSESTIARNDRGDLYRGSLTHKLAAGDRTLVIDYWTDADPSKLSATAPTTVKLSAHLEDGDTEHTVKVSRFLASEDDGTTASTLSDDRGEFVITPPYSYGTALTVQPADRSATTVTLSIQFDLLVETVPGSGAFFRQTVLDSVRIALPATPRGTQS
jgi:hypothetical protein